MAAWPADPGDPADEQVSVQRLKSSKSTIIQYIDKMNRRQYEQYVCKRIPGKQAVVVMACDNTHISDDMYV